MFTTIPNYYGMEGSQSHSLSLAESEGFEPSKWEKVVVRQSSKLRHDSKKFSLFLC